MSFDLFRLRKWSLTLAVFTISAVALFTEHMSGDNWQAIAIALLLAYGLDKWVENK